MTYDDNHDYTQGESIPEIALPPKSFTIGGDGATTHDAEKVESENSFHDLGPGAYLLKVTGFGDVKPVTRTTYVGGKAVDYPSYQAEVRFCDASDPGGRIRGWFTLPPDDPTFNHYYTVGGNEKGSAQSVGFFSKNFHHFIARLFPGQSHAVKNGKSVLTALVKDSENWIGRLIYAEIELPRPDPNKPPKLNPTTNEPYPARPQVKNYSYRPYVEGGPAPYKLGPKSGEPTAPARPGRPLIPTDVTPEPEEAMAGIGADAI